MEFFKPDYGIFVLRLESGADLNYFFLFLLMLELDLCDFIFRDARRMSRIVASELLVGRLQYRCC